MGPFRIKDKREQEGFGFVHEMRDERTGKLHGRISVWADTEENMDKLMDTCGEMLGHEADYVDQEEAAKGNA